MDQGSADAARRAAIRSRVEPVPGADHRSVRDHPDGDRLADAQSGITGYNDISPRIGVAYDLFGNGKTSLKANVGRYLHPASNQGRYINANPSERVSTITARPWTDANGNFVPDCNVLDGRAQSPATTGSIDTCGALGDPNFGRARPSTTLSDSILGGWGARPVRLAVRRVGSAGSCATGVRRSRVLPSVVADLRRQLTSRTTST